MYVSQLDFEKIKIKVRSIDTESIGVTYLQLKLIKMQQRNSNDRKSTNLVEKTFKVRNSPLIDRYQNNKDIQTIYNLFVIILLSLVTNTIISDYIKTGRFNFGQRLILICFNKFDLVILIWMSLYSITWLVYLVFTVWARIRVALSPKLAIPYNRLSIGVILVYYLLALYGIQKTVRYFDFAPASAAVLVLDQVRLLMKQHAFIRTNARKVVDYKPHSDQELILPNPEKFFYFTFAPTLLYRDEYPRTVAIRWRFVFKNFLEILGSILLLSVVVEQYLLPIFGDYGFRKFKKRELLLSLFVNMFPGIIFLLSAFYSVLHACQNLFAELLRFGDRLFYNEWWNCQSISEYFRQWNIIVHDWLYEYIYKEMYTIVVPKNRLIAKLTVFLISAIIHEWIVTVVLNLFLPVQFIEFFSAGIILTLYNLLHARIGNFILWYNLIIGCAFQINLYSIELAARYNSPIQNETIYDFLLPRFLTCDCLE